MKKESCLNGGLFIAYFQSGNGGVPKLKDTTLKTHAYITSKHYNFGGKPYEKADILRI